jgi:hypothetical protein
VLYEESATGGPPTKVTGLRLTKAGQEQIVEADAYVAALDVPGAKRLIPEVSAGVGWLAVVIGRVGGAAMGRQAGRQAVQQAGSSTSV